jgi:PAS domain S-box-containing protein
VLDQAGRIVRFNSYLEEISGYRLEEVQGQDWFATFLPVRDRVRSRDRVLSHMEDLHVRGFVHPIIIKNGSERMIEWYAKTLRDAQGRAIGLLSTGQDITERRRTEENLVRLSKAIESSGEAIGIADMAGMAIHENPAFVALYGYTPAELNARGGAPALFVDPALGAGVFATLAAGRPWSGEADLRARDGRIVPTLLRADCIVDEAGNRLGLVTVGADISARRLAEREHARARDAALESARLKSEFLANMSHEIRTPMNVIFGMTDLLLETARSEEERDYVSAVRRSAESLLTVIDDVLDLSKIEAGKLELDPADFDLDAVLDDALLVLAPRAATKELELCCLVGPSVPRALVGDAGRLRQILLNLVGNAVKFTERGEVVVRVGLVGHSQTYATLRFTITDSGIGVPAEHMHRLFESFSQVDGSMSRRYGGTGLGLAISKQLVEMMGGEIGVESEPGRGSTFWFTARFEQGVPQPRAYPAAFAGVRVLVIDGSATGRAVLSAQLAACGFQPGTALGGADGLEHLRHADRGGQPFRIALIALGLPDTDAAALARAIRDEPLHVHPACVLAAPLGRSVGTTEAAPFAAHLTKPVREARLVACLAGLLAGPGVPGDAVPDPAPDVARADA